MLHSERFADAAPAQVWATLLDGGDVSGVAVHVQPLLRTVHGNVRDRRSQASHPAKVKPELVAPWPEPGLTLEYHQVARPSEVDVLLPISHSHRHRQASGGRLGHRRPPGHRVDLRRIVQHGRRPRPEPWSGLSLRPGGNTPVPRSPTSQPTWPSLTLSVGRTLGQRPGRVVLRLAKGRVPGPPVLAHPCLGSTGGREVHRLRDGCAAPGCTAH